MEWHATIFLGDADQQSAMAMSSAFWQWTHGPALLAPPLHQLTKKEHEYVVAHNLAAKLIAATGLSAAELALFETLDLSVAHKLASEYDASRPCNYIAFGASASMTRFMERIRLRRDDFESNDITAELKPVNTHDMLNVANIKAWRNQLLVLGQPPSLLVSVSASAAEATSIVMLALVSEANIVAIRLPDAPAPWPASLVDLLYLLNKYYDRGAIEKTKVGPLYFVAFDRRNAPLKRNDVYEYYAAIMDRGRDLGLFGDELRHSVDYTDFVAKLHSARCLDVVDTNTVARTLIEQSRGIPQVSKNDAALAWLNTHW